MNSNRCLALLLLASLAACKAAPAAMPDEATQMQRWTEYGAPGPAHQALGQRVGTWDMVVVQFGAPGMPPMESRGSSTVQWMLDGRFLRDDTTAEVMGAPFTGFGLMGYDNLKKKYISTWCDSMSTGIATFEGDYDPATHTLHYSGWSADPAIAQAWVPMRSTERWIDADHWVMQSFAPGADGAEFMSMEIRYARRK